MRRLKYCVYDLATGDVLEEGRGPAGVTRLEGWNNPAGVRLRVYLDAAARKSWPYRDELGITAPPGVELVESAAEVPVAGGSIDTTTGAVLEARPEPRADRAIRDLLNSGSSPAQIRNAVVREMMRLSRLELRDLRWRLGLWDLSDTDLTSPGVLSRFNARRDELVGIVQAAQAATTKFALVTAWNLLQGEIEDRDR